MYRCVNELGMIGIAVAEHTNPSSKAPEAFPDVRSCKTISHPTLNHCYKLP